MIFKAGRHNLKATLNHIELAALEIFNKDKAVQIEIKEETRSLAQNRMMWSILGDIAKQTDWHGQKLTPEEYKFIFSAETRQLKVVPNLNNNGFIMLGQSTSRMTVKQMTDVIELARFYGDSKGVRWSKDSEYDELIESGRVRL